MKRIYLFCEAGMSTSMMVNKMREAAKIANLECEIIAFPVAYAKEKGDLADCILLGPQVRYMVDKFRKMFPNKPVDSIDMQAYGMMDGLSALKQAVRMIKKGQQ